MPHKKYTSEELKERIRKQDSDRYWNDPERRAKARAASKAFFEANKERYRQYAKEQRIKNPGKSRAYDLLRKWGMTVEEYEQKLFAQNGKCALCNVLDKFDGRRLAVDHDHDTGQIRDLLCSRCNRDVSVIENNGDRLLDYIVYWKARQLNAS